MGLYIVHVRASRQRRCVPSTLTNNFAVSPSFAFSSKHFLVVHYVVVAERDASHHSLPTVAVADSLLLQALLCIL